MTADYLRYALSAAEVGEAYRRVDVIGRQAACSTGVRAAPESMQLGAGSSAIDRRSTM